MVEYTEYIEIAHSVFKSKGGEYGENTAAELVETVAPLWSQNTEELKNANRREVRRLLQERLSGV